MQWLCSFTADLDSDVRGPFGLMQFEVLHEEAAYRGKFRLPDEIFIFFEHLLAALLILKSLLGVKQIVVCCILYEEFFVKVRKKNETQVG